jgi:DNA-directed RNA polymerase delta subunit
MSPSNVMEKTQENCQNFIGYISKYEDCQTKRISAAVTRVYAEINKQTQFCELISGI